MTTARRLLRVVQALAGSILIALALLPVSWVQAGPSLCLVKRLAGRECLGCGMTRGVSVLLHGDVVGAMAFNRGSAGVAILLLGMTLSAIFTPCDPLQAAEARKALRWAWVAVSVVALLTVLSPWVVSGDRLASLAPRCEWKARYNRDCVLCGMTTAFLDIRQGRFGDARRAHPGALPLFAAVILNQAGVVLVALKRKRC